MLTSVARNRREPNAKYQSCIFLRGDTHTHRPKQTNKQENPKTQTTSTGLTAHMDFKPGLQIDTEIDTWQRHTLYSSTLCTCRKKHAERQCLYQMLTIFGHCCFNETCRVGKMEEVPDVFMKGLPGTSKTRGCCFTSLSLQSAQVRGTQGNKPSNKTDLTGQLCVVLPQQHKCTKKRVPLEDSGGRNPFW